MQLTKGNEMAAKPGFGKTASLRILERMLVIRRFEESLVEMSGEKLFKSHYHLYIGQEATAAAVVESLRPDDKLTTTHRNHGHVLARGAEPGRAYAEILGRATGLNGGRGGTLHMSDPDRGFLATWMIYLLSWKTVLLAHKTIVVSKADEQIGSRMWFCSDKITRISIGRELVQFVQPEEGFRALFGAVPPPLITGATLRLASIAELIANKGLSYAIDAVEHLTHRGTDVIYVIAGSGEDKQLLQNYARKKGVSERVFFPGFIADAAKNLRGFDAYLSPSIKEGLPYALIEAAQSGIPVITTDIVREDFSPFPQFSFVPSHDGLALADAIEQVAKKSRGQATTDPFPLPEMMSRTMALYSH